MKRNFGFLILTVIISVLFSCDFQIPSAVEIRGSPEIKIAAAKDIGAAFTDIFQESGGSQFKLIECRNTVTRTYMLCDDFSLTFPSSVPSGNFVVGTGPGEFDGDLGGNTANVSVDFGGIITGFTLKPAIARIFVDGHPEILKRLIVKVTIKHDVDPTGIDYSYFTEGKSDVTYASGVPVSPYTGNSMPGNPSTYIPLPLDKAGLQIEFNVSLKPGSGYDSSWFTGNLSSEILVWVPLVFTADSDAAEIAIPVNTLFTPGQDLLGRGSSSDPNPLDGYVESLELSIVLKKNPFDGRVLEIKSTGGIEITHRMRGNAFSFPIDKENMELLNTSATYPFVPNFKILFEQDDKLEFPWDLSSETFVFKAKIIKRMEF